MKLSNKAYDILKWVALIAMDAIGIFYATVSDIWGLPYGDAVCRTCAAIALLLGALLGVSTAEYRGWLAKSNEDCYVKMVKEANDLREEFYPDLVNENGEYLEEDESV